MIVERIMTSPPDIRSPRTARLLSDSLRIAVLLAAPHAAFAQSFSPCGTPPLPPVLSAVTDGRVHIGDRILSASSPGQLEELYREATSEGTAGIAVLAMRDKKVLLRAAYGFADVRSSQPVTTRTRFGIGSITKNFTSAAILKLQEEGKLSIQDPVSKYFPALPRGADITLAELLSHTSGVHDITDRQIAPDLRKPIARSQVLSAIEERPLDFLPSTQSRYSNAGYLLLGQIIERVSGRSYEQYLQKTFFGPLKMRDTGLYDIDRGLPGMARGYLWNGGALDEVVPFHQSLTLSSGGLYSTVEDLTRWAQALWSYKALRKASVDAMSTPTILNDGSKSGYGLGLFIDSYRGDVQWSHQGSVHGYTGMLIAVPKQHFVVAVLVNGTSMRGGFDESDLARVTTGVLLGQSVASTDPRAATLSASNLDAVTGQYSRQSTTGLPVLLVARAGERLFAWDGSEPTAVELIPTSATTFFLKDRDTMVSFSKDPTGSVNSYTITSPSHTGRGARIAAPIVADVDSNSFAEFAGEYAFSPGFVMTISKRGSHLCMSVPLSTEVELMPTSSMSFFTLGANSFVRFERNREGHIREAVAWSGGGPEGRAMRRP